MAAGPAVARAPGKVILLGEHAVVHGAPALATSLGAGVEVAVELRDDGRRSIEAAAVLDDPRLARAVAEAAQSAGLAAGRGYRVGISGDLPVAVGLGSSAALAVALVRGFAAALDRAADVEADRAAAHRVECVFHGTPSGVDVAASLAGELVWFEAGPPRRVEPVVPARPFEVVVDVAAGRHDTGRTVGDLRRRAAARPDLYRGLFAAIGDLVRGARAAIERGDLAALGEAMTLDHGLLRTCGVSTPELDRAVERARAAGALGAKLTGGGGGGAIVALAPGAGADLAGALRLPGRAVLVARVGGATLDAAPGPR